MWKPAEVVPKHQRSATLLFSALVVAIFLYSGFLVYQAVEEYENPSTSFALSNNLYKYPDIYVCLYNFYGCDDQELEEGCMRSAQGTEGGNSTAVFNPGGDQEQDIRVDAFLTDDRGWCVDFRASDIVLAEGEQRAEDYILLNMFWYPGGSAKNASNTCIEEEGEWESHSESVFIHLRDSDTGVPSAGIQVAYSCMTSASHSHVFSHVGIGLTKESNLSGEDKATYNALSTSSAIYKDKRDDAITGIARPYAWLSMEIAQVTNSLEEIKEVDPVQIAEIFGNVGGFWDLLLLLWPVFFVAAASQSPHLKVRNFRKSVTKGFTRGVRQKNAADTEEAKPEWDSVDAVPGEQNTPLEHDPRAPRSWTHAPSQQGPGRHPISRATASRCLLAPQIAPRRPASRPIREAGVGNDLQVTMRSPAQGLTAAPGPLRGVPVAGAGSNEASAGFIV